MFYIQTHVTHLNTNKQIQKHTRKHINVVIYSNVVKRNKTKTNLNIKWKEKKSVKSVREKEKEGGNGNINVKFITELNYKTKQKCNRNTERVGNNQKYTNEK